MTDNKETNLNDKEATEHSENDIVENESKIEDKKTLRTQVLVLSVILGIVTIALIVFIVLFFSKKNDSDTSEAEKISVDVSETENDGVSENNTSEEDDLSEEDNTAEEEIDPNQDDLNTVVEPYIIQVKNPVLNIYDEPDYNANIVGQITNQAKYTIVEEHHDVYSESIWGKLKSGAGWINLEDAEHTAGNNISGSEGAVVTTEISTEEITEEITEDAEATTTEEEADYEYDYEVKTEIIKGIEFNYVSRYYWSSKLEDNISDIQSEMIVEYCEPTEYMMGDEQPTNIYRVDYMYDEDEIGDVYYSAGTDDFMIFKITVKGRRYESYLGNEVYDSSTIDYRRYNPYGVLLANDGFVEYEIYTGEINEPDIDEVFYIGLYASEVGRIDILIYRMDPNNFE